MDLLQAAVEIVGNFLVRMQTGVCLDSFLGLEMWLLWDKVYQGIPWLVCVLTLALLHAKRIPIVVGLNGKN